MFAALGGLHVLTTLIHFELHCNAVTQDVRLQNILHLPQLSLFYTVAPGSQDMLDSKASEQQGLVSVRKN